MASDHDVPNSGLSMGHWLRNVGPWRMQASMELALMKKYMALCIHDAVALKISGIWNKQDTFTDAFPACLFVPATCCLLLLPASCCLLLLHATCCLPPAACFCYLPPAACFCCLLPSAASCCLPSAARLFLLLSAAWYTACFVLHASFCSLLMLTLCCRQQESKKMHGE